MSFAEQWHQKLVDALTPFSRLMVADDRMSGMSPDEIRDAVAQARNVLRDMKNSA